MSILPHCAPLRLKLASSAPKKKEISYPIRIGRGSGQHIAIQTSEFSFLPDNYYTRDTAVVDNTSQSVDFAKEKGQPHTVATGQSHNPADTVPRMATQLCIPRIAVVDLEPPLRLVRTEFAVSQQSLGLLLVLALPGRLDVVGH